MSESKRPRCALCRTRQPRSHYPVLPDDTLSELCFGCLADELEATDKLYDRQKEEKLARERKQRRYAPIRYCRYCKTHKKKEEFNVLPNGMYNKRCKRCEGPIHCLKCDGIKKVRNKICDDCLTDINGAESLIYRIYTAVSSEWDADKTRSLFTLLGVNEDILNRSR